MDEQHFTVIEVDPKNELDAILKLERGYFKGIVFRVTNFDFSALDEGLPEIKFEVEVIKDVKKKTLKWEKFRNTVDEVMKYMLESYVNSFEEGENEDREQDS